MVFKIFIIYIYTHSLVVKGQLIYHFANLQLQVSKSSICEIECIYKKVIIVFSQLFCTF